MYQSLILTYRELTMLRMFLAKQEFSLILLAKYLEEPYGRVRLYFQQQRPVPMNTRIKLIEVLEIPMKAAIRLKFIPDNQEGDPDENH